MSGDRVTSDSIRAWADELGFLACGVAHLDRSAYGAELDAWLAKGYAGTMRYLHRQAAKRKTPATIVPQARVAVMVLENYLPSESDRPLGRARIAKYARGQDYHVAFQRRLGQLADRLRQSGATVARTYTDAGPVPERELAQRAGLGWVGKNTMLIRPGTGSFFFIGAIFTDLALAPDAPFEMDHCGSCTRCLDACPTQAFVAPRVLDATRCLSYLTIESRGEIPPELAERADGWAFGCDICNDVCPWNQRFAVFGTRPEYAVRSEPDGDDPEYFERLTETEFAQRFGDTPLERPGLSGMRRNWRMIWKDQARDWRARTSADNPPPID
jgi:epoxyqueuosine reductase